MTWVKQNEFYAKQGDYTLTQIPSVPYPFGLYKNNKAIGYFKTQAEALEKHREHASNVN